MSETEHITGKLSPVKMKENLEATAESILVNAGIAIDSDYETATQQLNEELYDSHIIIENKVYTIKTTDIDPDEDIFKATYNDDETIDFEVRYYNGGCGFSEAIEKAVKMSDAILKERNK